MTEDEAKTKWCPFARASMATERTVTPGHNRSLNVIRRGEIEAQPNPAYARCIGSVCMVWRWGKSQPQGIGYLGDGTPQSDRAVGGCGLAGAPQ